MGGDAGEERLEDQLVWVRAEARRLARRAGLAAELDELIGWGAEGLVEAARSFDPGRGVPFAAYARLRVRGAMLDGMRAMSPVPLSVYRARNGTAPAGQDSEVESKLCARFASARADGLLCDTAEAIDGPVATACPKQGPEALAASRQLRRIIAHAMADLPPDEAELVRLHVLGEAPLAQAAALLGVGEDRASRLYQRALQRLRGRLRQAAW
jgi:RNA polymerase sigma factor for flagellar operon FliA